MTPFVLELSIWTPYGIFNEDGRVPELVVGEILSGASICGINMLDTAQAYGDAQTIVGRNLPPNHSFQVVTKLASQQQQSFLLVILTYGKKIYLSVANSWV